MNGYLLDTNIASEFQSRPAGAPRRAAARTSKGSGTLAPHSVLRLFLKSQPMTMLFLSAVTIGEIRKGLVILPQSRPRTGLEPWFNTELLVWFRNRILPITHAVADRWGVLDGQCQLNGTPLGTADGMLAATAIEHDLTLVTRNVKDFARLGVVVFDPWDAA